MKREVAKGAKKGGGRITAEVAESAEETGREYPQIAQMTQIQEVGNGLTLLLIGLLLFFFFSEENNRRSPIPFLRNDDKKNTPEHCMSRGVVFRQNCDT